MERRKHGSDPDGMLRDASAAATPKKGYAVRNSPKGDEAGCSAVPDASSNGDIDVVREVTVEEILTYYHGLMYQPRVKVDFPEALEGNDKAEALRDVMLQTRSVLDMARNGCYDFKITTKGFISGLLKAVQSNLKHAAWLARCVADGDLTQRMDFLGEFSEAFNIMTKQLATMTSLMRKEEERWRLALECSRDGVFELNLGDNGASHKPFFSRRFAEMNRTSVARIPPPKLWGRFFHPEDMRARKIWSNIVQQRYLNDTYDAIFRLRCGDGVYRWRHSRGRVFRDPEQKYPMRVIGILEDIHDRKEREDTFIHLATHDALTGLANRELFGQHLHHMMGHAKRVGQCVLVVMVDLDKFKEVNDSFGHLAGDVLLQEFARRLQSSIRSNDIATRLGGDEFALLLYCDPDPEKHDAAIRRIQSSLDHPVMLEGKPYNIQASFGVAVFPQDSSEECGDEGLLLMKKADDALYTAKRAGRNTYRFWTSETLGAIAKSTE